MKRLKKFFAVIAIALFLVPVSVMVLPTDGDYAYGCPCWECHPWFGCLYGAENGWDACDDTFYNCNFLDGRCGIFE